MCTAGLQTSQVDATKAVGAPDAERCGPLLAVTSIDLTHEPFTVPTGICIRKDAEVDLQPQPCRALFAAAAARAGAGETSAGAGQERLSKSSKEARSSHCVIGQATRVLNRLSNQLQASCVLQHFAHPTFHTLDGDSIMATCVPRQCIDVGRQSSDTDDR